MATQVMLAKDAISGSLGECFVTIDGERFNLMQAINIETNATVNKSEIPILGKPSKGNKPTGITYEGKCTLHYNTSIFRKVMKKYKDTGESMYFDIQISNEDKTSAAGRQTIVLKDCNLNSIVIAKFDADGEYLDEEVEFTFEDWEMPEEFTELDGMR